ncbi:hypothetical protein V757_05130 [Pelistega indica]|uniref:Uncharacterized protein n=1 Tax=Pelistega indica TaxID=1414851 RepID=V8G798_9BURK|nr:hypothetical protein V757_05130 [Pelistega indica]
MVAQQHYLAVGYSIYLLVISNSLGVVCYLG